MIAGLLKQTDSTIKAIRGWGCYFSCLTGIAQDACLKLLTKEMRDDLFTALVEKGVIRSNDVPTSETGWWRAFVLYPSLCVQAAGAELGHKLLVKEIRRYSVPKKVDGANYVIGEYKTKYGSHFCVCFQNADLTLDIEYNPDPSLELLGLLSVRYWSVVKEW